MEARIKITIGKDGTVGFEVNGVQGAKCEDITKVLMENLGTIKSHNLTEDYVAVSELPVYVDD
jgi:hypothetical protein